MKHPPLYLVYLVLVLLWLACAPVARAQDSKATNPRVHTLAGTFRTHIRFHSRYLPTYRDLLVYLPPGYDDPKNARRRYPVLYLHDGQNVFDGATSFIAGQEWRADENAETLIRAGKVAPLIMVAIPNAGGERGNEYLPTRATLISGKRTITMGGQAGLYGRMLVSEIKPLIDRTYRTLPDAAHTGVCGSSLGGVLTLYLGLGYSHVFGKLAVVSPSVWWDNKILLKMVSESTMPPNLPRIWLDIGTREGGDNQKESDETVANARLLRDALVAKGWQLDKNLRYTEAPSAGHNEGAWAARIGDILRYLFPANE